MKKESIATCGLSCERCQRNFSDIKAKANELVAAMNGVNFPVIAKMIPFMNFKYKRFLKIIEFVNHECPGCRQGGGNPFCGIRKCATKRSYFTCAECEQICKRFDKLYAVHIDNEIQNNLEEIKADGIDKGRDA